MTVAISVRERVESLPWAEIERDLWAEGAARTPPVLMPGECRELRALYGEEDAFRSTVAMARHNFGEGEYRYFAYPLPPLVQQLRESLYARLAPIANAWGAALRRDAGFPPSLDQFLARCHAAAQSRPTPLLLRYRAGGWNALHQDLYGDLVFPLQATCFLSRPGADFEGGEFLLVEQRPRAQSRGQVLTPEEGELVLFATRDHPLRTSRGYARASLRHGVSRVRRGERRTLGVIFHDAL
ncbi:MAG TPA: 2OG-Fe(II) oxygenase [Candidatus Dormibacteraeota bacterium]|nr:2OG-Fe(II) oxygenase [Candidatus Dormibacteraeota bacterium]